MIDIGRHDFAKIMQEETKSKKRSEIGFDDFYLVSRMVAHYMRYHAVFSTCQRVASWLEASYVRIDKKTGII